MKVFVPATLSQLQELNKSGILFVRQGTAFAVTPALREAYTVGDEEELEEVALREAARASLRLLAIEHDVEIEHGAKNEHRIESKPEISNVTTINLPVRRVVVVVDVNEVRLRPELDYAAVTIGGQLPTASIISVHIDGAEASAAVLKAIVAVDQADLGDEDAELAVGDAEEFDLGWYATQELPFLLELL